MDGEVRALAFSGDALARRAPPAARGLVLERVVAGAPTRTILTTTFQDDDDEVSLAASPQAVALGLEARRRRERGPSKVMIGPPAGPLREVGTCTTAVTVSPVAVFGPRIAWREGGCGKPETTPNSLTASAIAVGGAEPGTPLRTTAGERRRAARLARPGGGRQRASPGMLLPSFFAVDGELRPFSPAGIGAAIASERSRILAPVGILGDGTRVVVLGATDDEEACDATQVFALAPGSTERRQIAFGGCVISELAPGPLTGGGPLTAGDRILAFVAPRPSGDSAPSQPASLVSVGSDGGDRRELVRGTFRRPLGFAADGDRVAWWQPACAGGREIVVQQGAEPRLRLASCRAEILTRRARVRAGRIALRVRCAAGCTGRIFGRRVVDGARAFSFDRGTHTLRVPVALGRARSARLRLEVAVEYGPGYGLTVSVRR